jgi:hypothetical protein
VGVQMLQAKSGDLQYGVYSLGNIAADFSMEINIGKLKLWPLEYWNKLILLIIWNVIYAREEKRI